jgi:hypothetical protein
VAVIASDGQAKKACTFLDSVISLCSKSIVTDNEMSLPVPGEDMFLLLVRESGIAEAKYWADMLGFPCAQSYGLLETLLRGQRKIAL